MERFGITPRWPWERSLWGVLGGLSVLAGLAWGGPLRGQEPLAASQEAVADAHAAASERLDMAVEVARRADAEIRHGFELADRKAWFSARDAFVRALSMVAEAKDVETGASTHTQALAAGLLALEEADDFLTRGAARETSLDARLIASTHRTSVLEIEVELTPVAARRLYYTFAQQSLSQAVGHEPVGSVALYALGKLHSELSSQDRSPIIAAESKALVYQQAALLAHPNNPAAANELGVLLARNGRWPEAREWLIHSVTCDPQPATWHNLQMVHQQLGEPRLAQMAGNRAMGISVEPAQRERIVHREAPITRQPQVVWVHPQTFAGRAPSLVEKKSFATENTEGGRRQTATVKAPVAPPLASSVGGSANGRNPANKIARDVMPAPETKMAPSPALNEVQPPAARRLPLFEPPPAFDMEPTRDVAPARDLGPASPAQTNKRSWWRFWE